MSPLRLSGSTSGYSQLDAPAVAGDQTFTLPGTGGTLDRLNRAGNILQVVNATYSTETIISSSTFADTGLAATITPSSTASKILIIVNQAGCGKNVSNTFLLLKLVRGSTDIAWIERAGGVTDSTATNNIGTCSICFLDSPATAASTTYKTRFASSGNNAQVFTQWASSGTPSISTITLIEVAA